MYIKIAYLLDMHKKQRWKTQMKSCLAGKLWSIVEFWSQLVQMTILSTKPWNQNGDLYRSSFPFYQIVVSTIYIHENEKTLAPKWLICARIVVLSCLGFLFYISTHATIKHWLLRTCIIMLGCWTQFGHLRPWRDSADASLRPWRLWQHHSTYSPLSYYFMYARI